MRKETESHDGRFERIVAQFGNPIWRLTAGYQAQRADREDLYQEILVALWRALPRFRGDCSERTFVYRVAHNRGITHRARARRRAGRSLGEIGHRPDPRPGPEAAAMAADRRELLMEAIRQLPLSRRQVVMLSLEGLRQREIADTLGITENNVAVRLARARSDLLRLMSHTEPSRADA